MSSLPVPPAGQSWAEFRAQSAQLGTSRITYTYTDEAPMLATYSLLPIFQRFASPFGINLETRDISLAGRIVAAFSDKLSEGQKQPDDLAELGAMAKTPDANIVKLPNISASIPQLQAAIAELQAKGYGLPNYPLDPKTPDEEDAKQRYSKVLGSAVNPVLREGNSDRRSADPVKAFAQKHPHKMKPWSPDSKCCVSSMKGGDFYGNEKSTVMGAAGTVTITLKGNDGSSTLLKECSLQKGEVIDTTCMSTKALREFFEAEMTDCKDRNLMMSLHMKATMMKVSDPIIFGHCVEVYFKDVFAKYGDLFQELGVNPKNGLGDVYAKLAGHPKQQEVEAAISAAYEGRPPLAMVNSAKGITNLHVPSDVIIDASMPCVVRDGGKMWNKDDALEDVKCLIPDRSYAGVYAACIEDCKLNGQFDVSTMGYVANVGLMAQKAEEYGSHDKTFEVGTPGRIEVADKATGEVLLESRVEAGDIWRMCQTKDAPVRDWVKLAVTRARASGAKAIFWLDPARPHDANIMRLAKEYIREHDTNGLEISFATPVEATKESCARARAGLNTISVTGNVLRDYLTDLFPIIELGTSAKMLSIVPLLAGGCLLETGAGGSAPKHVQQFLEEGHLRWDSLGEYLATAISFEELGVRAGNDKAKILGATLMEAVGCILDNNNSPSRKVKEIDNRGTNFYVAKYWAAALAKHDPQFSGLASELSAKEGEILQELIKCQGAPVDIGGYYRPDPVKAAQAMRPSATFNALMELREA